MENSEQEHSSMYYAGFWMRFWSYLVDLLMISSLNRLIVHPFYSDLPTFGGPFTSFALITSAMMYIYFVIMTKIFGQTLGKMIFGLKVVSANGRPLSWLDIVFREVIGRFISKTVFMLGYIFVAFTKKKQGWHDKVADTIVLIKR